ncbi:MAG: ribonuclease P protein component [Planctomycetia bacterium]|nr:ribonuclease P protein component [Planctomycetia bacterium]
MNENPADPLHLPPTAPSASQGAASLRFGKASRLSGKKLLDTVYKTGQRRRHKPLMVCMWRREDPGPARVAISIAKKCGSAVERNTIRRRVREAWRLAQHEFPPGIDVLVVVYPHPRLAMLEYQKILLLLLR